MKVEIELGPDLQEDYESWVEVRKSLNIHRTINNFLHYVGHYGTYRKPKYCELNQKSL